MRQPQSLGLRKYNTLQDFLSPFCITGDIYIYYFYLWIMENKWFLEYDLFKRIKKSCLLTSNFFSFFFWVILKIIYTPVLEYTYLLLSCSGAFTGICTGGGVYPFETLYIAPFIFFYFFHIYLVFCQAYVALIVCQPELKTFEQ